MNLPRAAPGADARPRDPRPRLRRVPPNAPRRRGHPGQPPATPDCTGGAGHRASACPYASLRQPDGLDAWLTTYLTDTPPALFDQALERAQDLALARFDGADVVDAMRRVLGSGLFS